MKQFIKNIAGRVKEAVVRFTSRRPTVTVKRRKGVNYKFADGTIFNSDERTLERHGHVVSLASQNCLLLQEFLRQQLQLSKEDIIRLFQWEGHVNPDQNVTKVVGRLREKFKDISGIDISCEQGVYSFSVPKVKMPLWEKYRESLFIAAAAAVCLVAWPIGGYRFYQYRQSTLAAWKSKAHETFRQALREEISKRDTIKIFYASSDYIQAKRPFSDTARVMHIPGVISKYYISEEQRENLLENDKGRNRIWTYTLYKKPIQLDTLNIIWDNLLTKNQVKARTQIYYTAMAFKGADSLAYSKAPHLQHTSSDSIVSVWVGGVCERKFTGYAHFVSWWGMLSWTDALWMLLPLMLLIVTIWKRQSIKTFIEKNFVRTKTETAYRFVVQYQKDIPCIFADGTEFNAVTGILSKAGCKNVKLSPTSSALLKEFVKAPNCTVSKEDLQKAGGWGKHTNPQVNLRSGISQLNRQLKEITTSAIISKPNYYILTPPKSI